MQDLFYLGQDGLDVVVVESSINSDAWQRIQLRDTKMPGGEKGESSDSSDDEDKRSADLNWKSLPLFSVPAAGSSGSPAGNTRAMARRAVANGKDQKKMKKLER